VALTPPATEAELLEAYHRSGLHRCGVSFRAALLLPYRRTALEIGVAFIRNPNRNRRPDPKALAAHNDD
jgi:hypothetical protein